MKTILKTSTLLLTFSLFGCATNQQVDSMSEQLKLAPPCPVGFKPSSSFITTFYSTEKDKKEKKAKIKTECVPEDLNTDPKMEWR